MSIDWNDPKLTGAAQLANKIERHYVSHAGMNSLENDVAAITTLTARIAALEVERDAAVARAEAAEERGRKLFAENVLLRNVKQVEAERVGERRATAAIVADLRTYDVASKLGFLARCLATRYERGDHLPRAVDAGEGK